MTQNVDVGDRLTAIGEQDRDVDQDLTAVMDRGELPAGQRPRQPAVSPTRSASNRTATDPACATTPVLLAGTDNPVDHVVCFTCEVPLMWVFLVRRKTKFPLRGRHFRRPDPVSEHNP